MKTDSGELVADGPGGADRVAAPLERAKSWGKSNLFRETEAACCSPPLTTGIRKSGGRTILLRCDLTVSRT